MIAEVYPLTRMPRKFGVFDYQVPEGLSVQAGDWVRIPFRARPGMMGIVARVKDIPPRGIRLKELTGLVDMPPLTPQDIGWYEALARDTAQSVSSILYVSLPTITRTPTTAAETPPPHRVLSIPDRDRPTIENQAAALRIRGDAWIESPDLFRMTCVVAEFRRQHPDRTVLVLFPNVSDAQRAWSSCGISDALIVTGDETPKSRRATWYQWRTQVNPILFGSRVAALWNRTDIAAVFILRSSHPNHKQADRNPRFDARSLAWQRREQGTTVYHLDAALRSEDILDISPINRITFPGLPALHVVDRAAERQAAPHPAIAYTTAERIAETLESGKRVLCAFNRKGSALRLRCQACREPVRCETCRTPMSIRDGAAQCGRCRSTRSVPRSCTACGHNELKQEGYGNESISRALGYLFPDATVSMYDKEHTDPALLSSQIIVTTRAWLESAFDPFHPLEHIGFVIELDADAPLYETSFRSTESAIRNVLEWRGAAHALGAQFLLQTDTPDVFYRIAENPSGVLAEDLETRRSYGYPPFRRILAVRYTTEDSREADRAYATLQRLIRETIPDAKIQQKQALFISVLPEQTEQILSIFRELDDKYVIDTNVS